MKASKILGIVNAVCGLLVMLTPTVILPVCEDLVKTAMGTFVPMRCHYTAQGEIQVGAVLALVGGLIFVYGNKSETRGALSAVVLALGVAVILIPTVLMGVCANPDHPCNAGTKPALLLLGAVTMLLGAAGIWQAWRASSKEKPLAPIP